MDFRDVTKSALAEYREGLEKACAGLSKVELRWQPTPTSNHILWLAWHVARVEDSWLNRYVGGHEQVWVTGHWCQRLHLPAEGSGAGSSAEEVESFPDVPLPDVFDYHAAVRESAIEVIDGLTAADLEKGYTDRHPRRTDGPTVSWVLAHVAVEEAQHIGQIAYIRGMLRGLGG